MRNLRKLPNMFYKMRKYINKLKTAWNNLELQNKLLILLFVTSVLYLITIWP